MRKKHTIVRSVLALGALAGITFAQGVRPSAALSVKPLKIDIESARTWQVLGDKAIYDIVLKDAHNQPAKAEHLTPIIVSCVNAAGAIMQQTEVQIKPGESKATWACATNQTGPMSVEARQKNNELLGGKSVIFVTPATKTPTVPRAVPNAAPQKPARNPGAFSLWPGVRLLAVAQTDPLPQARDAFHIQLLGSETDALANGSSEAHFQVCFTQGDPEHRKAVVLYAHDGGTSNSSLEIPASEPCGATTLTSRTPGKVTVRIVGAAVGPSGTAAAIDLPNQLIFTFHKVIADLRLEDTRPTMSLIDSVDLVARFYDADNHVTSAGEDRVVAFDLAGAGLFKPRLVPVLSTDTEARTTFFPTYWGPARVSAATSTLAPTSPKIIVVGVLPVFVLTVLGGAIGALISYARFRDVIGWRVFVGVVTGLFLVWLASSGFVPKLSMTVVHSVVSGFFLALAGGYAGLPVLNWFLKLTPIGTLRSRPAL